MSQQAVLNKILGIREHEKKMAQLSYTEATKQFEDIATKLYNILKKKETVEVDFNKSIQITTEIEKIKEQSAYIEILNKSILSLQQQVNKARVVMENKQTELTTAHVEVKKFEKLIENRENTRMEEERKIEMMSMDEISIRQHSY